MGAETFFARARALPFLLKQALMFSRARLRKEPDLHDGVLKFVRQHAEPGNADSVLACMDRFAREERFLMNVGMEKGARLEEIVSTLGPGANILELGSFVGYSAILMARHLKQGGRLISVDIGERSVAVSRKIVRLAGLEDRVEFVHAKSTDYIKSTDLKFDLFFLDHWKGLYLEDSRTIMDAGLMRPGAVFVADNLGPLFGQNPYKAWMLSLPSFVSTYESYGLGAGGINDAMLISTSII